jgi:amino acid transporter
MGVSQVSSTAKKAVTLERGVVGLAGAATMGAIMMAPALGLYGNWGPLALDVGVIAPLMFLVGLFIAIPTAISYAVIARVMPSAGSAYTWLWRSLTPSAGIFIGWILIAYYIVAVVIQPYIFGLYFNELIAFMGITGVDPYITYLVGVAVITILGAILVYGGIQLSVKGTLVMMGIEVLVAFLLCATILVSNLGKLSLEPFNPGAMGGAKDIGLALIIMVLSYTGFDVISTVAEESHSPRSMIPRATIIATVGVAAFWIFGAYALSIAVPTEKVSELVASGMTPVVPIAADYWGSGKVLVILTALTAATGVFVACAVGASRVLYAMGREGTLPSVFAGLHPKYKTPWTAQHLVFAISIFATVVWPFWLDGNIIRAFVWWAGAIAFFALVTYLFVNLANILYFTRIAPTKRNWFTNIVVPVVGLVVDAWVLYKAFFESLLKLPDWRDGVAIVGACLIVAALGIVYVMWIRSSRPKLLEQQALVFDEGVAD